MAATIIIDKIIEQRDVDAALYLLQRMLGARNEVLGDYRTRLEEMKKRVEKKRSLTEEDRHAIVSAYREVIG
jgi:hypothetical protein